MKTKPPIDNVLIEKLHELKLQVPCGLTRHATIDDCIAVVRQREAETLQSNAENFTIGESKLNNAAAESEYPGFDSLTAREKVIYRKAFDRGIKDAEEAILKGDAAPGNDAVHKANASVRTSSPADPSGYTVEEAYEKGWRDCDMHFGSQASGYSEKACDHEWHPVPVDDSDYAYCGKCGQGSPGNVVSSEIPDNVHVAADNFIAEARLSAYGPGNWSNGREGDFGTWEDWRNHFIKHYPKPVIVDLEVGAKAMHAKTKYGKLGFPKHDAGMAWINKAKACAEAWGLKWK